MRWNEQVKSEVPDGDLMASGQVQGPGGHHAVVNMPHSMPAPMRAHQLLPPAPPPGLHPAGVEYIRQDGRMHQEEELMYANHRIQDSDQLIAPTAKKLWGVEEARGDNNNKGLFNIGEQTWRDTAWSTGHPTDPGVAQSLGMGVGGPRGPRGQFTGDSVLSPRGGEPSGVGVKMVEYLLASSPTAKDLDARMVNLSLRNGTPESMKDKKDKSQSPFDAAKKELENGNLPQSNGNLQNGLDDDKAFNRTPGSRQGSPFEEDHHKNGLMGVKESDLVAGGVVMGGTGNHVLGHHLDHHHHHAFDNMSGMGGGLGAANMGNHAGILDPSMGGGGGPFSSAVGHHDYSNMTTSVPLESPSMLQGHQPPPPHQNFTDNQIFRNGAQPQGTPQQLQLLAAQQQFLAAQQQGLQTQAAFNAPYIINGQEPYVGPLIAGPTAVIPQYYGVHWGVYPANIIQQQQQQQGGAQPRRPPSPSQSSAEVATQNSNGLAIAAAAAAGNVQGQLGQYQVIPTYYDQNGAVIMGNLRGMGNGGPVRLVSPAPIIINSANGPQAAANNMRLMNNQAPQIGTPPNSLYGGNPTPTLNNSQTFTGNTLADSIAQGLQTSNALTGNNYSLGGLQNSNLGFGNNSLGNLGNATLGTLSGGLGGANMNRRDSLDRTASVLSPLSQDFRSKNWPGNYGALGTVTASPGPIGLPPSGSLTPPPSLNSSTTGLPLGALVSGNRSFSSQSVMSAAPGAENKFRNGTANGIFNPGGPPGPGLFPPLKRNLSLEKCSGRSRLLEDFRNNRFPNLQLLDLTNHIVEFSQDQHGSRFIQQKLERAVLSDKQMVFNEILPSSYSLMTDVFGNYVIQKFFEFGSAEQKSILASKIRGHVLPLALQMYGCRVIQKALECISQEQQKEIVRELDGHILKCVKDQNGNHVVQKCIECVDPTALQFIISSFHGQVVNLSTHPYGCRVIQRILEHCTPEQTTSILDEIHQHNEELLQDQYGNYVIQHVLEHGKPESKAKIVTMIRGALLKWSQHKFASNVVEKCVTHSTRSERSVLIEEACGLGENNQGNLLTLMKDQYANYVIQKMIDVAEPTQRKIIMHKIRPHIPTLKKYTYGKHIIAKLERYFMKNPNETMPNNITSI